MKVTDNHFTILKFVTLFTLVLDIFAYSKVELVEHLKTLKKIPRHQTYSAAHKAIARNESPIEAIPVTNCNTTEEEPNCGTVEFLGCTGSKKFYHESSIKMTWFEGWEYCRSIGLHLASIESRYEQAFIEIFLPKPEIVQSETYWTSGTDLGKEGKFSWMATGKLLSYGNFRPGEPNNRFGAEDCIELVLTPGTIGYPWNDRNCLGKGYVLCQQDLRYPEKLFGSSR